MHVPQLRQVSRSRIASEFLDALEIHIGRELPFRHRFDAATGQWSGEEFTGLVSNRNLQPDAYDPEARIVVEFLGNFYHGFPPEHPQHHSSTCVGGRPASEVYAETMARLDVILAEGLQVVYIWEHDFREWQRKVATGASPKITGYMRRHGVAQSGMPDDWNLACPELGACLEAAKEVPGVEAKD
ncbi:unnamed protein product [Effrenium voratum]|nr:unnamed protein product [Effrenium voratum]